MNALVVDDSRTTRSILRRRLEELGFEVEEATDGEDALRVLDALPPFDVVLVDWNMPGMDGLELVRAVRSDRRFSALPVMMVTAEIDPANMARALMAGADEYAMKPLDAAALAEKLALLGLTGAPS